MNRKMANVAGILSIVFGGICAFMWIIIAIGNFQAYGYGGYVSGWWYYAHPQFLAMGIMGIIFFLVSVAVIVIGSVLVAKVRKPENNVKGLIITLLVLNVFGSLVPLIFTIIALCMSEQQQSQNAGSNPVLKNEFEQAIARFKQYKEDGIITEEEMKKKIEDLVKKHYL